MMQKKGLIVFSVATLFLLTGCSSSLRSGSDEVAALSLFKKDVTIVDGETSQAEVLERFGCEYFKSVDEEGQEQWIYRYTKGIPGKGSRSHKYLIVTYDDALIVTDHQIFKTWVGGGNFSIEEILYRSINLKEE